MLRPDLGTLWRHRAAVLAAIYGFLALVGALYYALLLGEFGQNAFHYWEATDFLLAAFREPVAIGFGLIAVTLYFAFTHGREMNDLMYGSVPWIRTLIQYDRWRESRLMSPRVGPLSAVAFALVWFLVVMGSLASLYAMKARNGKGEEVRYLLEGQPARSAQLLTTTNRFVFLVEPGTLPREAKLVVVPVDALLAIEHCGARRGGIRRLLRGVERCEDPSKARVATNAAAVDPAPASAAAPGTTTPAAVPATGVTP